MKQVETKYTWWNPFSLVRGTPLIHGHLKLKKKKKQKGERTHIEIVVATCYHQRPQAQPNHRT